MSIRKYQCECCSAPLEVKPGMRRITCAYCGMVYQLEERASSAGAQTGSAGDNPVDVRLVPMGGGPIALGCWNLTKYGVEGTLRVSVSEQTMEQKLTFFAALALLRDREIPILGQAITGYTSKYLPPVDKKRDKELCSPGSAFTQEEIDRLVEPRFTYSHMHRNEDALSQRNGNGYKDPIAYDREQNAGQNRERQAHAEQLFGRWGIQATARTLRTPPGAEAYHPRFLLIRGGTWVRRYWTNEFTVLTFRMNMTPRQARASLGAENLEMLQKLGRHAMLDQVAAEMADMMNRGYEEQLRLRKPEPVQVDVYEDYVALGGTRYGMRGYEFHYFTRGMALTWTTTGPDRWYYKEFGLGNLPGVQAQLLLGAQVLSRLLPLCEEDGTPRWNLTSVKETAIDQYKHQYCISMELYPAAKAEAVYESWV